MMPAASATAPDMAASLCLKTVQIDGEIVDPVRSSQV